MSTVAPYPVRVEGHLERPSRGLWLLKWLLLLPHYVVLGFLWVAMALATLVAFLVVLFTGRYPRGVFEYNLGVLRWTWRVAFYAYGANGTDRYPPFTLGDVADYPARLEIPYPERQRRGLPLLGWWLAAIPHYLIVAVFVGGGVLGVWHWGGLITVLVLCGVVVLLFTGSYPRGLFDFVLGLNRWAIRVVAYCAVMTPEYPPFRVDVGELEPGGLAISAPTHPGTPTGGKVVAGAFGGLAALIAAAAAIGGTAAVVFDQTQRDAAGYVATGWTDYSTPTYALLSKSYRTGDLAVPRSLLGTIEIRVRSTTPAFVGIARSHDVSTYLRGVAREVGPAFDTHESNFTLFPGVAPSARPSSLAIWAAKATGRGELSFTWNPRPGSWRVVLMDAKAVPGVHAQLKVGARLPHLGWIGAGLLGGGLLVGLLAASLIYTAARPEQRRES